MEDKRTSGILLHPTSLPSRYGIGDLGSSAYDFADFLQRSQQSLWQILPLCPVGYGESPYQSLSAFAGNTMLISIELLIKEGLLSLEDVKNVPAFDKRSVEFQKVKRFKEGLYRIAFRNFKKANGSSDYDRFMEEHKDWIQEFAFFMSLKNHFNEVAWVDWDVDIAFRKPEAVKKYKQLLAEEIAYNQFLQFVFFKQWMALKAYVNGKGIKIIGDLPIFISGDSSDAWSRPELFEFDALGNPTKVAGVPPDYFSKTGQLWGNPHYRWDVMKTEDYQWWCDRFKHLFKTVDIVRIDHFRGFESYWEIPGKDRTAVNGKWVKGPGKALFERVMSQLGDLPIIAEDLGFITPEVAELKAHFGFPGMKILQFAFGNAAEERFLPHNYEPNSVVYTGTHDNDTVIGWFRMAKRSEPVALKRLRKYYKLEPGIHAKDFCWKYIEIAFGSNSNTAIIPLQDVLGLGTQARMNTPSTIGGNWKWRFEAEDLTPRIEAKLKWLSCKYHRN